MRQGASGRPRRRPVVVSFPPGMRGWGFGGPLDSGDLILRSGGRPPVRPDSTSRPSVRRWWPCSARSVFFAFVGFVVVNAPGWSAVQSPSSTARCGRSRCPTWFRAFLTNVQLFCIAEVLILILALRDRGCCEACRARFCPSPADDHDLRDFFRAVRRLIIYILGFWHPRSRIAGVPTDPILLRGRRPDACVFGLCVEVYRAGIQSIHPSRRPRPDRSVSAVSRASLPRPAQAIGG